MGQIKNITDSSFQIESPLPLPEDEVQLWRIDLEALGADESRWQRVLSADESARASRFHFARDRQRFVAARALLRIILASYLETDASSLSFSYSKKEKPSLGSAHASSGVRFNISHSGGVALLAFTRAARDRRRCGTGSPRFRSWSHRPPIFFRARTESTCGSARGAKGRSLLPLLDPERGIYQGNWGRLVASPEPIRCVACCRGRERAAGNSARRVRSSIVGFCRKCPRDLAMSARFAPAVGIGD